MTKRPSLASNMKALSEATTPDPVDLIAKAKAQSDEGQKFHAPTREGMKRILTPVEPQLHKQLKLLAVQQDITLELLVRTALQEYLSKQDSKL